MAGLLDPVDAGEHVLQIAAAHVEQIGLLKFLAVSGRAAIVGREHHVSLIGRVLHEAVERIHGLRRRPAVNVDDGGVLPVARHVEGHIEKRGNRPLAVAAGIVHQIRLDHVLGAHAGDQRMRDLMRLAGRERVDPEIAGGGRAVVVVEQARAVVREGRMAARRLVHAFGDRQRSGLAGREVVQINVFVAVDVGAEGDVLAVGRELAAANFPFVVREP